MQKILLSLLLLACATSMSAQTQWPSPEIERMYNNGKERERRGDLDGAIIVYKQAIQIAPGVKPLYLDLANALYLAGRYEEASTILTDEAMWHNAELQYYILYAKTAAKQINSVSYGSNPKKEDRHVKDAHNILNQGLEKFPASGELYHIKGLVCSLQSKKGETALSAWLQGIKRDPAYADNYRDASIEYLKSGDVLWGLLYGEMFLAMAHDTIGDVYLKRQLFAGYKTLFDNIGNDYKPQPGKADKSTATTGFADAVRNVYRLLAPVVSDGFTTETLTMLRVRFLMDWFAQYDKKYPFPFFDYQQNLIKNGRFDVYNEWLFGAAESETEYKAWNLYHEGDMVRFLKWRSLHLFVAESGGFYNERALNSAKPGR